MRWTAAFLLPLFFSASASAIIIDNGTYTTDTGSSLDWLDVTTTQNQSFDTVTGRLTGDLSGWQYANLNQVEQLFGNWYGVPPTGPDVNGSPQWLLPGEGNGTTQQIIDWMGSTNSNASLDSFFAIVGDEASPGNQWSTSVFNFFSGNTGRALVAAGTIPQNFESPNYGSFLVRESASVPEPPFYAALLAAFGLLAYRRYKQK